MTAHTTSIGIEVTEHGPVHTIECPNNCIDGYEPPGCEHGGNCDCSDVFSLVCDRCHGEASIVKEDCDCSPCVKIIEDMEAAKAVQS